MLSPDLLASAIKAKAVELGFDLVGIAPGNPTAYEAYWRRWIAEGKAGEMDYLAERLEERLAPGKYLEGARSAICVAVNYHVPLMPHEERPGEVAGRIARYALPEDYHEWIKKQLRKLADWLRETSPGAHTKAAIDTAPIAERELSARAGVGWVGKNTCIISPKIGSWLFLGTVLTTLDLPTDEVERNHCGTCTRCLEACPTGAISPERPYQLDATRCISYLTIEHRSEIPADLAAKMGDWLYGCDICQDVCPFNRPPRPPAAEHPNLQPRIPTGRTNAAGVLEWGDEEWRWFSKKSAIKRLGLPLLKRNAEIVVRNRARADSVEMARNTRDERNG